MVVTFVAIIGGNTVDFEFWNKSNIPDFSWHVLDVQN